MPETTINEGGLCFVFQEGCDVIKADEWPFFLNHFRKIQGTKSVDMIARCGNTMWLIEVKDYRYHQSTKASELAKNITLKMRDSLAMLATARFKGENGDDVTAQNLLCECHHLRVVLHLEQSQPGTGLFHINPANIKTQMKKISQCHCIDPDPLICSLSKPRSTNNLPWSVRYTT